MITNYLLISSSHLSLSRVRPYLEKHLEKIAHANNIITWEDGWLGKFPIEQNYQAALSQQLPAEVDINFVSSAKLAKQPKLLIMDVDSTMIQQETIDELAKKFGVYQQVSAITERAMRGELDFAESLQQRLRLLIGLTQQDFYSVLSYLTPQQGLSSLLAWCKKNHMITACVSGGFELVVSKLAQQYSIAHHLANRLEFIDEKFTGKVISPIIDKKAKADFLIELCEQFSIAPQQVTAIGDGANDSMMLAHAGLAIGYQAKPVLAKQVDMVLHHTSLAVIAYLYS
jgi:phosphoserine phosphatase